MIKILAIDDILDNLTSLKAVITTSFPESEVITAQNGSMGIELAAEHDPDVILLDIMMPVMDGFEVCRRLKENERTRDIPVVYLTALRDLKESRIKALEAGGEGFLSKPVEDTELLAQIRAMVKIRAAARIKEDEKDRLERHVKERTVELENSQTAMLNLMEDLKAEIDIRRQTEEKIRRINKEQTLLSKISSQLVSLLTKEDVYHYIGQEIYELAGNAYMFVAAYHAERKSVYVESLYGLEDHIEMIRSMNIDPDKMEFKISEMGPRYLVNYKSRKLINLGENSFYNLSAGKIGKKQSKLLESVLMIKETCFMGFTWNDRLYGGVGIMLKENAGPLNTNLIETIINQAAIVIQRMYAEEELRERDKQFTKLASQVPGMIYQFKQKPDGTYGLPFTSEAIRGIYGCSPANVTDDFEPIRRTIHPDDLDKVIDSIQESARNMTLLEYEYRVKIPNNPVRWLYGRSVPEKLDDGSIIWHGFIHDVTEKKLIVENLTKKTRQLRELSAHLDTIKEEERMVLARDIHDVLGSSLAGLKLELAIIKRLLDNNDPDHIQAIRQQIESMSAQVDDSVTLMRKVVRELRPGILDELGLVETMCWDIKELRRRSAIRFNMALSPKNIPINKETSIVLYRIFQAIITNIIQHAQASNVTISLKKLKHVLIMQVSDDGIGIRHEDISNPNSFGIQGMQERVILLNGRMNITGSPGKGTTVVIEIPIIINK